MIIKQATIKNFGSYLDLTFDFDNQGLCLIQGPTGSGKSTLCDIIPWILFGKTAKDGGADEVRSWYNKDTTEGTIYLDTASSELTIYRSRAPNDLYFKLGSSSPQRGKDLLDTQKMINSILGFDYDVYSTAAYFHEFSKTAHFFTATAKTRRTILEQIVDLTHAKDLQESISAYEKTLKPMLSNVEREISVANATKSAAVLNVKDYTLKSLNFDDNIKEQQRIAQNMIQNTVDALEKEEATLAVYQKKAADNVCSSCGSIKDKSIRDNIRQLELAIISHINKIEQLSSRLNETKVNNYSELINNEQRKIHNSELLIKDLTLELKDIKTKAIDLELLSSVVNTYRASIITNTVEFLENKTNTILSNYFDAELKVSFNVSAADKLDVTLYKDGRECSYTQLSKGQRQLLKLSFGLSIMETAANHQGLSFNSIFLDEALDGLDDTLKVKAYGLLQSLQVKYSSVFVVEHSSELKALFEKSYYVTNNQGVSYINEK